MIASCADDVRIWQLNDDARTPAVQSKPVKQFVPHHAPRVNCISWNHNSELRLNSLTVLLDAFTCLHLH